LITNSQTLGAMKAAFTHLPNSSPTKSDILLNPVLKWNTIFYCWLKTTRTFYKNLESNRTNWNKSGKSSGKQKNQSRRHEQTGNCD
jgi:hypothetical protein